MHPARHIHQREFTDDKLCRTRADVNPCTKNILFLRLVSFDDDHLDPKMSMGLTIQTIIEHAKKAPHMNYHFHDSSYKAPLPDKFFCILRI